jgi:hypothetical protein
MPPMMRPTGTAAGMTPDSTQDNGGICMSFDTLHKEYLA